jgi:hypothetical protein
MLSAASLNECRICKRAAAVVFAICYLERLPTHLTKVREHVDSISPPVVELDLEGSGFVVLLLRATGSTDHLIQLRAKSGYFRN